MAKRKKKTPAARPVERTVSGFAPAEFDERIHFAFLLLVGALYFAFSYLSDGVYQDDEIGHVMKSMRFWHDPASILTYWDRPGFKLVYALPALIGVKAIHLTSIVFTVSTCYLVLLIARKLKLDNPLLSAIFCGLQPLLLQLSFRTYAEVLAGFLLSLMLLTYLRKQYLLAALTATFLFTVRQEYAILAVIMGGSFLYKKKLLPFFVLGASPVILALLGWLKTGNILWLVEDYLPVGKYAQTLKPGFFHYWRMFEPIFGTIPSALFIVGFFSFIPERKKLKKHLLRFHAVYITFVTVFVIQCLLTAKFVTSPSPGHFRYLLPLAPVAAIFANIGFNQIWSADKNNRTVSFFLFMIFTFIVIALLSNKHNHYSFIPEPDMSKALVLAAFAALLFLGPFFKARTRVMVVLTTLLLTTHTLYSEEPIAKSPEHKTVEAMAEWYRNQGYDDRTTLINHAVFYYNLGRYKDRENPKWPGLYLETVEAAPAGSIVIWDSHYSYRPEYGMDVNIEFFKKNPGYVLVKQFVSSDKRYVAIVFEKSS